MIILAMLQMVVEHSKRIVEITKESSHKNNGKLVCAGRPKEENEREGKRRGGGENYANDQVRTKEMNERERPAKGYKRQTTTEREYLWAESGSESHCEERGGGAVTVVRAGKGSGHSGEYSHYVVGMPPSFPPDDSLTHVHCPSQQASCSSK